MQFRIFGRSLPAQIFAGLCIGMLCLSLLASPASAKGKIAKLPKNSVYFDRYDGRQYTINVSINGQGPFVFMIDTGATKTSMFDKTRRKLGLQTLATEKLRVSGMNTSTMRPVLNVPSFEFASQKFENSEFVILKDWHDDTAPPLDGILGLDMLDGLILSFNHKRSAVSFRKRDTRLKMKVQRWEKVKLIPNPYKGTDYGLLFTFTEIGDLYIPTMVDTGAGFTAISWNSIRGTKASKHKKRLREEWVVQGAVGQFNPKIRIQFDHIDIGGMVFDERDIVVMNFDGLPINANGKYPLVITGVDLMDERDFILDLKDDYLYVSHGGKNRKRREKMRIGRFVYR